MLSDSEEAERRRYLYLNIPLRNQRFCSGTEAFITLFAWLFTVVLVGLNNRADLIPVEVGFMKVFLPGGAGLVGLIIALLQINHPDWELLVVDKKPEAVGIARKLVSFLLEDL